MNILEPSKAMLVEYLATPKGLRSMTLKDFAIQELKISEPTIHAWKKDADIQHAVKRIIKKKFSNAIPDVVLALRDQAISGNVQAAKIFLEYVDDWKLTHKKVNDIINPVERTIMTKEQVQECLAEFRANKIIKQ